MKTRLNSNIFDLPVQELRRGYRSDIYFWREKIVLERHGLNPNVTVQVFQKNDAVLCGIDEAIAVLKLGSGRYKNYEKAYKLFDRLMELKQEIRNYYISDKDKQHKLFGEKLEVSQELDHLWENGFEQLEIDALFDGDLISPREPVMYIKGDASLFAHLETIYLGILARRTKIATNVRNVVKEAAGADILFFPARFDHWSTQGGDGYAAHVGGASVVSTDAQAEWWGAKGSGTIPHSLIASLGGDTLLATKLFHETYPNTALVALVDFDNDCVSTALECARALGEKLRAVRLDTSENMVDKTIVQQMGDFYPNGVIPELVFAVRKALDTEGFGHVKIVASGGFTPEKIARFKALNVPVDAYGVGSYLMMGSNDFTADVVLLDGKHCAKSGRRFKQNDRLRRVTN
ncbi:MAG: hypothetical protein FWG92_06500 [Leptospirales bacterium]|nr:hypothetical protein [Leptospirales bacterium]